MSTVTQTIYQTTLQEKKTIAKDLLELRFEKPEGFVFDAGQFIQCHIPDGDSMVLRSYSLSSTPSDPYLELCVKLLPEGKASRLFAHMNVGDKLQFQGPQGRFTNLQNNVPLVCIATGAGMAPIMSLLRNEAEQKKNTSPIKLLFGVRSEADIFWTDRLDILTNTHPNISSLLTLSQPTEQWRGQRGRVTTHASTTAMSHAEYFLCGSIEMVKDVRQILTAAGIEMKKIHFEIF